jgi:streptomycin 6-kinase
LPALVGLLRRLWEHLPPAGHPFRPLREMCDRWADSFEADYSSDSRGLDPGIARDGIAVLRELPRTADRAVLLCTAVASSTYA